MDSSNSGLAECPIVPTKLMCRFSLLAFFQMAKESRLCDWVVGHRRTPPVPCSPHYSNLFGEFLLAVPTAATEKWSGKRLMHSMA